MEDDKYTVRKDSSMTAKGTRRTIHVHTIPYSRTYWFTITDQYDNFTYSSKGDRKYFKTEEAAANAARRRIGQDRR